VCIPSFIVNRNVFWAHCGKNMVSCLRQVFFFLNCLILSYFSAYGNVQLRLHYKMEQCIIRALALCHISS